MSNAFRSEYFGGHDPQIDRPIIFGDFWWDRLVSAQASTPYPLETRQILDQYQIPPNYGATSHAQLSAAPMGYCGEGIIAYGMFFWPITDVLGTWVDIANIRVAGADDPHVLVQVKLSYFGTSIQASVAYYILKSDGTTVSAGYGGTYTYSGDTFYLGFGRDYETDRYVIIPTLSGYQSGITSQRTTFTVLNFVFSDYILHYVTAWGFINEDPISGGGGIINTDYGEYSTEMGYTGVSFDDTSDTISVPSKPSTGVLTAGFLNVYNPTLNELQGVVQEIFPAPVLPQAIVGGDLAAIVDAIANLYDTVGQMVSVMANANLIQNVISCHLLPVAAQTSAAANVQVGYKSLTSSCAVVIDEYVDFDCGEVTVDEYYANFADYSPYTEAKLFLPFVGYVPVPMEYVSGGTIKVVYRFNVIDGTFMAYVIVTSAKSKLANSVVGQYSGSCIVHIPLTGTNYSSMVEKMVGAGAGLLTQGLTPSTIGKSAQAVMSKPDIQMSNPYSGSGAIMSVRQPFLLIGRPVSDFSEYFPQERGLPCNITCTLGDLSGFTVCGDINMGGFMATQEEKDEILALLQAGVIL